MKWIKCSDRLPEQNVPVLVFCDAQDGFDEGVMLADWYDHEGKSIWFCVCHQTDPINPTHWMMLPQHPK